MPEEPNQPVFYDPEQRRWTLVRAWLVWLGMVLFFFLGLWALSVAVQPALPALGLQEPDRPSAMEGSHGAPLPLPPPATKAAPPAASGLEFRRLKKQLLEQRKAEARGPVKKTKAPEAKPAETIAAAYFVNWDPASLSSLKANLESLDLLIPEWLHLKPGKGKIQEDTPATQKQVMDLVRAQRPELKITPLINNYDGKDWAGEKTARLLSDPAERKDLEDGLLEYAKRMAVAGLSIDFEEIPASGQADFERFLDELALQLHAAKLTLSVNLPLDRAEYHYKRIAQAADHVILMAYDEHWSTSKAGPIASQGWIEQALKLRGVDLPREKTILALGNYAYDWPKTGVAEDRSFLQAVLKARDAGAQIELDPGSRNPRFRYLAGDGKEHELWLLDAVTAFNQIASARAQGVRGFALWRLGGEDPTLWTFYGKDEKLDAAAAAKLETVSFPVEIQSDGRGEIFTVGGKPAMGRRAIAFDEKTGRIASARYVKCPSPYVIRRYGAAGKKIALTFDDGPDPDYTPRILDILKEEKAPATFFVVGERGERDPGLLLREFEEGHELGNHTFTHPDITKISALQLQLELTATQRLLESLLGRNTLLFRPPYGLDTDPRSMEEVLPLETAGELGYLSVGMKLDPLDWMSPPHRQIVQRVLDQLEDGGGNIVLLHDSGGDREQTVKALPDLIHELRASGYELVTVSALLGKTRDQVMPVLPPEQGALAALNHLAFGLFGAALTALNTLFILGIVLGTLRLLFIGALAVVQYRSQRGQVFPANFAPSVAVVVPAYNEEKVVAQTIRSLLASEYAGPLEIVVVDDGSKDGTFEAARKAFEGDPRVRVFTKPNGGKPAALNFGIAKCNAEIVVALDADTVFRKDTVAKLVRHFHDQQVGAVAGNAKVGNRLNLLTRWQALEYVTCQNLDRRAFSVLNCITVVPGAVGAWRRDLVTLCGGFTNETLAEDADLTIAIRREGYKITYEDGAYALTEAPDTFGGFLKQRFRWMFGTIQAAWKHRGALFRAKYGALGWVALPNILIFQVLFPLVSPVMDVVLAYVLGKAALDAWWHPESVGHTALYAVLGYYALFQAFDFAAAVLAFSMEPEEDKGLLPWLFLQRFCYRQAMYYVAIKSTFAALRGMQVGWGKLERKATVQSAG
ncbi:MAG: glycosyltransferase [Planctomycetes bacterium]|nr:glycosyltransferase [Planctomycetota bacterium]